MQAQTGFCYRCSSEQGENGSDLEVNLNDPGQRLRCREGTGCARLHIGCARCSAELVPGKSAPHELKLADTSGKDIATWWVCSPECAYLLGMRHARELIERDQAARAELLRARNLGWHSAASPTRRRARGGRA